MEMAKNCEKCNAQNLRYQEDMWGGYQNCFICGWEVMVWRVSEDVEYGLVRGRTIQGNEMDSESIRPRLGARYHEN